MALSYTTINTTPENLGDNNLLYINAYEVSGRGTLIQAYIQKPFNVQVPLDTNPPTFRVEQVNPILSEQSFFAQDISISDLTGIRVSGTIPWTTLLTETLPRGQKRLTRSTTISGKGSLVHVYTESEYKENNKPKLTMSMESLYWVDGIEVSGTDLIPGTSGTNPHFGEIWNIANTSATILSSLNVWYQYLLFNQNGISSGTTPDHTNDHITISKDGSYLITVSISYSGGPLATYETEARKNNGAVSLQNVHAERLLNATGDIGSVSMSGLVSLSATDTIELWIRQTGGALASPVLRDVTLSVSEIGR